MITKAEPALVRTGNRSRRAIRLLCSAAILAATPAFAQGSGAAGRPSDSLEEIVVTATRQVDTVNRVPLAITAATQKSMDERGIVTIADLLGIAPGLSATSPTPGQSGPGQSSVAIRGISDGGLGATTTGFYLDDTPLQKRNAPGFFAGNGSPLPPLFDLDRVEILRGPQGTLFGGGSEGGAIRFITPAPSLSRYSVYAKTNASTTKYGKPSYEGGLAVGGPLIKDKLGFRASYDYQRSGGWVDIYDRVSNSRTFSNSNSGNTQVLRVSALWAPTERARVTLAYFSSRLHVNSLFGGYSPSTSAPFIANQICFNTTGVTPSTPRSESPAVACNSPTVTYARPGFTYGPYDMGPGKTVAVQRLSPGTVNLRVPTLTLEYDLPGATMKYIGSYISDDVKQTVANNNIAVQSATSNFTYGNLTFTRGFATLGQAPEATYQDTVYAVNRRRGMTHELRFSSSAEARPLTWVAGVFYSTARNTQAYDEANSALNRLSQLLYGITVEQRYGVGPYLDNGVAVGAAHADQRLKDTEIAGFGDLNFWATEKLKLTAGLRVSRISFDYEELHYGPLYGFNVPTPTNGGGPNKGSQRETPITPKFGAQYSFTPNDLVYLTAAKGYRAGGANPQPPALICAATYAQFGLTPAAQPLTYNSDSVWNYELGGKFRMMNNKLQVNADAFHIDWKDPQLPVSLPSQQCPGFTSNGGKARSQGFELEVQAKLARSLTGNLAIGYTDAEYRTNTVLLKGATTPLYSTFAGQSIPVSPFTVQMGLRQDIQIGTANAYLRGDFKYLARYKNALPQVFAYGGIPNGNYMPDNVYRDVTRLDLRAGLQFDHLDISAFVLNVTNDLRGVTAGGRRSCAPITSGGTAACTTFNNFAPFQTVSPANTPRQIGIQAIYRY